MRQLYSAQAQARTGGAGVKNVTCPSVGGAGPTVRPEEGDG